MTRSEYICNDCGCPFEMDEAPLAFDSTEPADSCPHCGSENIVLASDHEEE